MIDMKDQHSQKGHDHAACVAAALERAETVCLSRGGRLTPIRRRVLELVWRDHSPVKAYDLLETMRDEGWSSAPSLVYRALAFLDGMGLVHHLASLNAYIGCRRGGEIHSAQFFVCDRCGAVSEIDDDRVETSIRAAAERAGFTAEVPVVEIRGTCTPCRERALA